MQHFCFNFFELTFGVTHHFILNTMFVKFDTFIFKAFAVSLQRTLHSKRKTKFFN